jgi:hypothetical protein
VEDGALLDNQERDPDSDRSLNVMSSPVESEEPEDVLAAVSDPFDDTTDPETYVPDSALGRFVQSLPFQLFIVLCIVLNTVFLAMDRYQISRR